MNRTRSSIHFHDQRSRSSGIILRKAQSFTRRTFDIEHILSNRYHNFAHYNLDNPLWELVFIICSVKTAEGTYRKIFERLRGTLPSLLALSRASEHEIAQALLGGGLQNDKAARLVEIMKIVLKTFHRPSLVALNKLKDSQCEEFLTSLPGVGKKVARCVMMYSLGRQVFPVDTHCWRICRRLGWVRPTAKDGHPTGRDMDRLQAKIPPELRFSLHVNMVSLGREFCTARDPDCGGCPVADLCPKVGVKKPTMRRTVEHKD